MPTPCPEMRTPPPAPSNPSPPATRPLLSLAVLGAGGHGRSVADVAEACGWKVDMYDDSMWPAATTCGPWTIVGNLDTLIARLGEHAGVAVAIGDCAARLRITRRLQASGVHLPPLVHPSAWVSPHAKRLGAGCVVLAGAAINVGAAVGQACIVNTGATVDHDCTLAAGVHISPGAHLAGGVTVGECTWVGIGAAVKQGVCLGGHAVVGAGAVVVSTVSDGVCVIGCPAKPMADKMEHRAHARNASAWRPRMSSCWSRTCPS